ncbi:hypothetical protein BpHYR1_020044 [Brachionus plicatilis]|uniref:Uncharacterized protein n=1 Tax=Brachionus plicatilis TaxID=10195 RepID=A0A3M7T350_BRAPC|nr:hypothetical protein BpHYR1_020044 [Brachionus plicatilis]
MASNKSFHYRWRNAHLDTPINPFKNSELFDKYKGSEKGVNEYTQKEENKKQLQSKQQRSRRRLKNGQAHAIKIVTSYRRTTLPFSKGSSLYAWIRLLLTILERLRNGANDDQTIED